MYTEYYLCVSINRNNKKQRNHNWTKALFLSFAVIFFCIIFLIPIFASATGNAQIYSIENTEQASKVSISKSETRTPKTSIEYQYYDVPKADTGFKAYMSYKAITAKSSKQWELQQDSWTDENGFRRLDNFYMVAMGTYYSKECGAKFHITMESGYEFDVIMGDVKSDEHTDILHQHRNGNVMEFIVDTNKISNTCRVMGDMSYASEMFSGKIAEIRSYDSIKSNR